jgi:two-component system, OmpR family, sensor kinase
VSLRTRLLVALGAVTAVALIAAGFAILGLTRAALVERVDRELMSVVGATTRVQRLADLTDSDTEAGRRLAVMRLDKTGAVVRSFPSGFSSDPDPLPVLPRYTGGIPSDAYGVITQRSSADGSLDYRVLLVQGAANRANPVVIAIAAPMTGVQATERALVRTLLVVGLAALGVLLVVAWVIVRRGLLPLERIAGAAERISAGDLSHRAGVSHDGSEVGRLGTAFDTMLDQLESAFDEQRHALEAKERTEAQLRRFAADASHELRTPLTAVRGYADLYRAGGLADPEALATAMDRIGTESRRMSALVEDLMLLARLDQGRPMRRDPVDLSRIAEDAVADLRAVDPRRPAVASIEPGVVVPGDDDRLRQVVGNLIANVRVHTGAGSPVEVLVRRVDGLAELRVVDHGPGIDPGHGARVFDRFYRADAGRSRESGGTGLGLSIVASLVDALDGRIWHEPTPGGGATFVVRLVTTSLTGGSQPAPGGPTVEASTL